MSMIEEGATVRNRQELIKLPDSPHEGHRQGPRVQRQYGPGRPTRVSWSSIPMPDQRFRAVRRSGCPDAGHPGPLGQSQPQGLQYRRRHHRSAARRETRRVRPRRDHRHQRRGYSLGARPGRDHPAVAGRWSTSPNRPPNRCRSRSASVQHPFHPTRLRRQ
jgi:hypothetical protein